MRKFINNLGNIFTKPLLRSPLHGLISRRILLITFTGRRSGRVYTTPTEYIQHGDTVTLFTQKSRIWWQNLRGGAPVTLRLRGRDVPGNADAFTQEDRPLLPCIQQMYPRMSPAHQQSLGERSVMIEVKLVN
jgi:deazaflavin-dependent oxidoreductase (nitroreductase family)